MMKCLYLCTLTLTVLLIISYVFYDKQRTTNEELLQIIEDIGIEKMYSHMHKVRREQEIRLNGRMLDNDIVKISDTNAEVLSLKTIINGGKLILYFSDTFCDLCIENEINNLNKRVDLIGDDNIVLLIESSNNRYVAQVKHNKNIKYPAFRIDQTSFDLSTDIQSPAYFYLGEENQRVNSAFIPDRESSVITDNYLIDIAAKYFK